MHRLKLTMVIAIVTMAVYSLVLTFGSPLVSFLTCTFGGMTILYVIGLGYEPPEEVIGGLPGILGIALGTTLCFWRMPYAAILLPAHVVALFVAFVLGALVPVMKMIRSL